MIADNRTTPRRGRLRGTLQATLHRLHPTDPAHPGSDRAAALITVEPDGAASTDQTAAATLDPSALQILRHAHGLFRGPLAAGIDAVWIDAIREATRRNLLAITSRLVRHYVP